MELSIARKRFSSYIVKWAREVKEQYSEYDYIWGVKSWLQKTLKSMELYTPSSTKSYIWIKDNEWCLLFVLIIHLCFLIYRKLILIFKKGLEREKFRECSRWLIWTCTEWQIFRPQMRWSDASTLEWEMMVNIRLAVRSEEENLCKVATLFLHIAAVN